MSARVTDNCRSVALAMTILCMMAWRAASAESWKVEPFVKLTEEYDDNPRLIVNPSSSDTDTDTVVTGAVDFMRKTEVTNVKAEARVDGIYYSKHRVSTLKNQVNQRYTLDAEQKGERSGLGFNGYFYRDSLLRTVQDIVQTNNVSINPSADVDEGLVSVNVQRDRLNLEPRWSYHTGERSTLGMRLAYLQETYDKNLPSLTPYKDGAVVGRWDYKVSELSELNTTLSASRFKPQDGFTYTDYQGHIGVTHHFTEVSSGGLEVGYHHTQWDNNSNGTDTGYLVQLTAHRDTGLTQYSGMIGRNIYPSGSGDLVQADELVLKLTHELSPRMRFWGRFRLFQNQSLGTGNIAANRRYLSVQPVLSYSLTRWWTLEGSYRYRRQRRDVDTQSADSNYVSIAIQYSFPTNKNQE